MSINKNDLISIIYNARNDTPKYFEISRKNFIGFLIALPIITLIGISLGVIGLVHTSPFHLIQNYKKNSEARTALASVDALKESLISAQNHNAELQSKIKELEANPPENAPMANSIGLSTLSFFKPVLDQKDKTRPASLELNGFKVVNTKDTTNFEFNINNLLGGDVKLSGHIIVLMKNEQAISVYPANALAFPRDFQLNYTSGEPFATQRFRPVNAIFKKALKSGNYVFTIFIFSKNGDLIHFQSLVMPVSL